MNTILVPKFKLNNILKNIDIFINIIKLKKINVIIENLDTIDYIVDLLIDNMELLTYFDYSVVECSMIEDLLLNGFEYPGVKSDFINELNRKNELSYTNELSIYESIRNTMDLNHTETKKYLHNTVNNAVLNNIPIKL